MSATGPALRAYLADVADTLGAGRVAMAAVLVFVSLLLDSAGLLLLVPLLQLVNGATSTPALTWLLKHGVAARVDAVLALFMVLVLLRVLAARRRELVLAALRIDFVDALRGRLERALAMATWARLSALPHADVLHLLLEQMARVQQGTHQLLQLLAGCGLAAASLLAAAVVAPLWTAMLAWPMTLFLWLARRRLLRAAALGRDLSRGQRASMATAREFLAGLKLVKSHAAEARYLHEFRERARRVRQTQLEFTRHQAVTRGWIDGVGALLLSLLLYAAAVWGRLPLPELVLIVFVFARLLPFVREAQAQLQQLAHMLPAYRDIAALSALDGEEGSEAGNPPEAPQTLREQIELDAVAFAYAPASPPVLQGLSLRLAARKTTVLMGPSGSGKTTLADIAAGLLSPTAGVVKVDGAALSDAAATRRWRRSVGYVAQDAYLLPVSVRENLIWLCGPQPDAALWAALEKADAAGFVAALPGGLDHVLGERGEGLSGGERQRLALARALLGTPELLILDEVTSQLDAASEERVLGALDRLRGELTILVIAHRTKASEHADRTIRLAAGRVVEDTDFEDGLKRVE